jgi:hypothetical protein
VSGDRPIGYASRSDRPRRSVANRSSNGGVAVSAAVIGTHSRAAGDSCLIRAFWTIGGPARSGAKTVFGRIATLHWHAMPCASQRGHESRTPPGGAQGPSSPWIQARCPGRPVRSASRSDRLRQSAATRLSVGGVAVTGTLGARRVKSVRERAVSRHPRRRQGLHASCTGIARPSSDPKGRKLVLIMARPDLSLSDWPKRPRCSPPPVTTLRTPLKLVFRKWPCRQTPTATVRGDRSHPRGGSSCRQGGGMRES